ncbi:hypothetical protein MPTK2_8g01200 [Marchantia polymorpha subsp. ruderalis]
MRTLELSANSGALRLVSVGATGAELRMLDTSFTISVNGNECAPRVDGAAHCARQRCRGTFRRYHCLKGPKRSEDFESATKCHKWTSRSPPPGIRNRRVHGALMLDCNLRTPIALSRHFDAFISRVLICSIIGDACMIKFLDLRLLKRVQVERLQLLLRHIVFFPLGKVARIFNV